MNRILKLISNKIKYYHDLIESTLKVNYIT